MKFKITFSITLFLGFCLAINSQSKTCSTPKEDLFEDMATITKCSIKPAKKSRGKKKGTSQVTVRVSANRTRFIKRRQARKKNALATATKLGTSGVLNSTSSSIDLKKSLVSVTNVLSSSEIKKAKKFIELDKIPTFKKCRKTKKDERLNCFNLELISHINKHFYYPAEAVQNNIQGQIWVRFIIAKDGTITNIKTMGDDGTEKLEEVATYVVSKLPNFEPGTKDGDAVSSKYGFPIDFSLQND